MASTTIYCLFHHPGYRLTSRAFMTSTTNHLLPWLSPDMRVLVFLCLMVWADDDEGNVRNIENKGDADTLLAVAAADKESKQRQVT